MRQSEGYSGSDIRHVVVEACTRLATNAILQGKATGQKSKVQLADFRPIVLPDIQV